MAEAVAHTQNNPQPQTVRPRHYDLVRMRKELEDFVEFHEKMSQKINGNKGYIRELMVDDEYVFGVYMSLRHTERVRPRLLYYYDVFRYKQFTQEDIDVLSGSDHYLWTDTVPISELLAAGNVKAESVKNPLKGPT